ncbi:MAG: MarR family transcriptional regulator, partial [Eubacteriales bacterium]|nr:MarR family transcriptional regulator [Eubacteriales bacterium]
CVIVNFGARLPPLCQKPLNSSYYLLGLLSAFQNRFQAMADHLMKEISWKQFFLIICINMCKEDPTIKELAEIVGSSHQNVKQLLIKLENKEFVEVYIDEMDKRKQRIRMTEYCKKFCEKNDIATAGIMEKMFSGITEEQLSITIETLTLIDKNMTG